MRRAGTASIVLILFLGCTPAEDQPDGGLDPDTGVTSSGLLFRFESRPILSEGGEVEGDHDAVIHEVEIDLMDVRAIGDAAPGDERTSRSRVELEWEEQDWVDLYFAQAPPGLYSQLLAKVSAYEIEGRVTVDGEDKPFRIDEMPADVALMISLSGVNLEPGMAVAVPVQVELDRIIKEIDWDAVPEEDGVLRIDFASPQIDSVRGKIKEMFQAASAQPIE